MPGYQFTAYDLDGHEQRGVLESDSPRLARLALRERGLFPLAVSEVDAPEAASAKRRRMRLGSADLSRITRQLATLLEAGLTVEQTFNAVIEQAETESERQLLAGIRSGVLEGKSLGEALAGYPATFSDLYRTLVVAGETSGKLPQVLTRLADYVETAEANRQKLMVAMIYPAIVMVVCLLVVAGLLTYVVPQVIGVFENTRQTLPLLTRVLLWISRLVQTTGVFWVVAAVLGFFAWRTALKRPAFRLRVHAWLLRVPVLGRLIRAQESAQLAATLSILIGSGVPVLQALQAGVGVLANMPMRVALERATVQVREGATLSRALLAQQTKPALFPPIFTHLIASGEASGRLTQTLDSAARQQQRDVDTRTAALAAMIEPAMMVVMGLIVLFIVLSVLLPIFELNQLVAK